MIVLAILAGMAWPVLAVIILQARINRLEEAQTRARAGQVNALEVMLHSAAEFEGRFEKLTHELNAMHVKLDATHAHEDRIHLVYELVRTVDELSARMKRVESFAVKVDPKLRERVFQLEVDVVKLQPVARYPGTEPNQPPIVVSEEVIT